MNELIHNVAQLVDPWSLLTGAVVVMVLVIQWSIVRRISRMEAQGKQLVDLVVRVDGDVAALCSASRGAGTQMIQVGKELHRLTARQEQLELRGGERAYQQAITLVQRGASSADLVNQLGLARAEADLVVMLHGIARAS